LFGRTFVAVVVVGAVLGIGPAFAQEDLNRGKTPAQLFASDCSDCHKNPRALGKRENAGALADFLRVHYTASRESAAAIAGYLAGLGADNTRPAAARPAGPARPRPAASQEQKQKQDQGKSVPAAKPAEEAAPKPSEPAPQAPAAAPAAAPASEPAPAAPPANPQ
jgi:hypothetical protein